MSRGFDGFEIDDFRDSCFGWERDTDRNRRPSSDWNNRLAVSSIREADSGWRATEPISKQTSEGGPCSNVALDPDQSNWGNSLISFPLHRWRFLQDCRCGTTSDDSAANAR